ncbi:MAG: site-specific integrase [Actinomycetota bacterium]|nr:site-specific integrase [Actinomycetota bacterium]
MAGKRQFGNVRQLPSGRWQAFYRYAEQRHKAHTTFETKMDAEGWLVDERRQIERDDWTPPEARRQAAQEAERARRANTFEAYARAWLTGRHDLRPTTRASYTTALERNLLPAFGPTPMEEITTNMVRAWFQSYGERTPTARAHAYQVLASIMRQAEDDDVITRTPCRIRSGGRSPVKREPEVLTMAELLALADAMPEKHRAFTLLSGLCGLRFGEAAALRRRDVDLDAATLTVARTAVRAGGRKSTNAPKTRAGRRTVAMPNVVVEAMREHLRTGISGGRDGLIFPGEDGNLLAPTALYGRGARVEVRNGREYQKAAYGFHAAREAVDKPTLHWHDLRRTAATLGAQSGATVREMQHRLGHTTPAMALHYQSATADRDRAIAERLQAHVESLGVTGGVVKKGRFS